MTSITFWTRLEPFTRLDDIETGVQVRVHDPLWLLARQWQTGEFHSEDAGTPVQARVRMARLPLARFHPGPVTTGETYAGAPYRADIPLEALVEREPVQVAADPRRDLRLAAEAGLTFLRMLEQAGVAAEVRAAFVREPAFTLTAPPDDPVAGQDADGDGYLTIMSGRVPDGFDLYQALTLSLRPPGTGTPGLPERPEVPAVDQPKVIAAGQAFLGWFESRYSAPRSRAATSPAWIPERMEYSFAVSAPTGIAETPELTLSAPEYPGGTVDWHSFDVAFQVSLGVRRSDPRMEIVTRTVMPSPVRYPGMAADRWWQFEDSRVNVSRIEGDPDELMRLLLVEFALLYSNDWYVLPVDATPGALYHIRSLVVTDAFGERTLVPHYGGLAGFDWQMYSVSPTDDLLFLPPVLAGSLHGDPIEEVVFVRDEVSNLVWAVERLAPSLAGGTLDRQALYRQRAAERPPPPPPPDEVTPSDELRYRLATAVPEHWIPFLPRRIDPAKPDIRLQRAAALLERDGRPAFSRPLGRILEPQRRDLSLFEEEVPPSGLRVVRHYQYARWSDGQTLLWLARRKGVGRGPDSSGLRFDFLEEA